jgi:hypothetical protein
MFSKYVITLAALFLVGGTAVAVAYEDPENKIGDRYPFLEQIDRSVTTPAVSAWRMKVQRNAKLGQFTDEEPENKIGDRYPFLEQSVRVAGSKATVNAMRIAKPSTGARKASLGRQGTQSVY